VFWVCFIYLLIVIEEEDDIDKEKSEKQKHDDYYKMLINTFNIKAALLLVLRITTGD
jgi:hypothetical protein